MVDSVLLFKKRVTMKRIMMLMSGLALITSLSQIQGQEMPKDPQTRALPFCSACPTGAARFCSLCVTGPVVVGDLTVQGTLTLCNATGPTGCLCSYDGELSFNAAETTYNAKEFGFISPPGLPQDNIQSVLFANNTTNAVVTAWNIPPSFTAPNLTVTAEFQIPEDYDPTVPPQVTLHWLNLNQQDALCLGNLVNWQVTSDFFANGDEIGSTGPLYEVETGDTVVLYAITGAFRMQEASVFLATGPALIPGAYGQVSTTRVAPSATGAESDCYSYLTVIDFKYHKLPQ